MFITILSIGILNTRCFEVNGISPTENISITSKSEEQRHQIAKIRYMQEIKEQAYMKYQKELESKILNKKTLK